MPPVEAAERYMVRMSDGRDFGPVDAATIAQWARDGRVPANAMIEPVGGAESLKAADHPATRAVFAAPPTVAGPLSNRAGPQNDSGISLIIPYRNGYALAAYYTGVFSLIPGIGLFLSLLAITFGIVGLKYARKQAASRGRVHAWIGIVIGSLVLIGHIAAIVAIVAWR